MTDWVRLWHDMPTDPKWRVIARRSGRSISEVIAVFNFIMVNASANATERGRTHNLFADDIAAALDLDCENVEAIFSAMEGKVISQGCLTGWERRQPKREDNSALRAKEWREKQRSERNRTQPNATERPETETETEKNIITADAAYAFSGSVIRLKQDQWQKWEAAFKNIDLLSALQSRDDWLANEADEATRKKWFMSTSNYLRNLNQQPGRQAKEDWEMPC